MAPYQVNRDQGIELGGKHYPLEGADGQRTIISVARGAESFAAAEQLAEQGYLIRLEPEKPAEPPRAPRRRESPKEEDPQ